MGGDAPQPQTQPRCSPTLGDPLTHSSSLFPPLSARDGREQGWEWGWGCHCSPQTPLPPTRTERWGSSCSPQFSQYQPHCSSPGHWGTPRGWGCMRGVLSSLNPVSHTCGFVPFLRGAPPYCSPGPGRVTPTTIPHPAPQAEKVSQICRNRSKGGRQRHCHRFDVTPARPTGAAITPGPRSHRRFAINSCEKGRIMQKKYFLPHLHPVPTVPAQPAGLGEATCEAHGAAAASIQPCPPGAGGLSRAPGSGGRFLSSGADSCRASCGFPLRSPPSAVTPSAHAPVPRVNPPRRQPPGAGGGSPWGSVSCWAPLHPPCTQSLPYIPPTLCTAPCTPFAPQMPPCAPLNTPHTPHTLLSALPTPPCVAPVPQGSVPGRGDTEPPHHGTFPTPPQRLEGGGCSTRP